MFYIFQKNFGNWMTSCQNFNKIYSNNLDENDGEEKELIDIELTEKKKYL